MLSNTTYSIQALKGAVYLDEVRKGYFLQRGSFRVFPFPNALPKMLPIRQKRRYGVLVNAIPLYLTIAIMNSSVIKNVPVRNPQRIGFVLDPFFEKNPPVTPPIRTAAEAQIPLYSASFTSLSRSLAWKSRIKSAAVNASIEPASEAGTGFIFFLKDIHFFPSAVFISMYSPFPAIIRFGHKKRAVSIEAALKTDY